MALALLLSVILLFVLVCRLDDLTVEEIVWVNFVDGWQNDCASILTVQDGHRERVEVDTFVDLIAKVHSGSVEGVVIFSVVEDVEQSNSLVQLVFVENGEDFSPGKESLTVQVDELLYGSLVLEERTNIIAFILDNVGKRTM